MVCVEFHVRWSSEKPVCVLFKSFHSCHCNNIIRLCSLLREKPVYPRYFTFFEKQSLEDCEELLCYNDDHFEGFSEVGNQDPGSLGPDSGHEKGQEQGWNVKILRRACGHLSLWSISWYWMFRVQWTNISRHLLPPALELCGGCVASC